MNRKKTISIQKFSILLSINNGFYKRPLFILRRSSIAPHFPVAIRVLLPRFGE